MLEVKNELEQETLRQFQKKVGDVEKDETTCLRFLIAREFNISLAEEMLRNNVIWRKEVGIENYQKWTMPEDIRDEFEFEVTGISRSGGPVMSCPLGRWNARTRISQGKGEEMRLFGFHIFETAFTRMKELNNTPCTVVMGMETLNYYKVAHMDTLKTLYHSFQVLENNYPEILQQLIIINAPWVFSIAFNFVKPTLSQRTLSKLQVFGSEREKWLPALREWIPDDAIPREYLDGTK